MINKRFIKKILKFFSSNYEIFFIFRECVSVNAIETIFTMSKEFACTSAWAEVH